MTRSRPQPQEARHPPVESSRFPTPRLGTRDLPESGATTESSARHGEAQEHFAPSPRLNPTVICAWCPHSQQLAAEAEARGWGLVSHGLCPPCHEELVR